MAGFLENRTTIKIPQPQPLFAMYHILPVAAAGYSFIYLLFGGGIGGAILIYIVAKLFGK